MNEQEQRIAIAMSLGTLGISKLALRIEYLRWDSESDGCYYMGHFKDGSARPCYTGPIPNYLHDLNACHEAVSSLSEMEYEGEDGFTATLARITQGPKAPIEGWKFRPMQEATAAQRCEAYLRAKGLWKEDAP